MQSACAAFYCHLWPVCIYQMFHIISKNERIFEKKKNLVNIKCVLIFITICILNISNTKKNSARN